MNTTLRRLLNNAVESMTQYGMVANHPGAAPISRSVAALHAFSSLTAVCDWIAVNEPKAKMLYATFDSMALGYHRLAGAWHRL